MKYNSDRIKRQIQAEAELYDKFGSGKIWNFIVNDIFNNDTKAAKEFMLSNAGGYDSNEINRIVKKKQNSKERHMKNYHY